MILNNLIHAYIKYDLAEIFKCERQGFICLLRSIRYSPIFIADIPYTFRVLSPIYSAALPKNIGHLTNMYLI